MTPAPGGPAPDDTNIEGTAADTKDADNAQHLSLADIVAPAERNIKHDKPQPARPEQLRDAHPKADKNAPTGDSALDSLLNPSDGFQNLYGRTEKAFQPDIFAFKAEYKPEEPASKIDELVDQFLRDTEFIEDPKPKEPENPELTTTRQELADAQNPDDIIDKLLKLARLYEHLQCVEEAKKAVSISLGIDPNNPQALELFKNLEHVQLPDVAVVNPPSTTLMLSRSALQHAIRKLSQGKVIVLGDLIIDEMLEGSPERISREAPILIFEHVNSEFRLGGAGNAAHNVAALGGTCHALGVCGVDSYAEKLGELLQQARISYDLVEDPSRPTTVKTRIVSSMHSFKQQLLRLDRISHQAIEPNVEQELINCLYKLPQQFGAIVVSDYTCGAITSNIIAACKSLAKEHKLITVVDAQRQFERFQNFTLLTPNQPDAEGMVGFHITDQASLRAAGKRMLEMTSADILLLTRGAAGMILFERNKEPVELEAFNRSEVFDVTGAGDTVVAAASLALITGASPIEAMAIGNLAASIVVKKTGAAVVTQEELLSALELLSIPD
jgi:rfaE bifunctional protein kinase chain/domain